MTKPANIMLRRSITRRGITLVEAVVSIVVVGLMFTAAINTLAAARKSQKSLSDQSRGKQLAIDLVNEILEQAYATSGAQVFGLDAGKSNANRSQFTDVDDYNGWTESPPRDRSGNALPGTTGWSRSVSVTWADPSTWAPTSLSNTGLKLITVTVSNQGTPVSTMKAYRSVAWVDTIPTPSDATSNHPPVAVLNASKTIGAKPLITTLDASGSTDQDNDTLSYVWKFGDGTTGNGATVSHTYSSSGIYTATVTVYDGRGGASTASVFLWAW